MNARAWAISSLLVAVPIASWGNERAEAKARLQNIEQHIDDWNIAGAKEELEGLRKLVPPEVETLQYFEGRIAFEEGRYADAVGHFEKAGLDDKGGSYLRLARDTLNVTTDHEQVHSDHFIFSHPKGKDAILAPYALETLEAIRRTMEEDLGYAPPGKVRVEVVNDAHELAKVSTLSREQIRKTGTIAICKFSKLMVTSPKAVITGYDWQDTLAHEYIHLVVSQLSRNTVPIWLHEGLAKYLESRWRGAAGQAMTPSTLALLGSRVAKNDLIPFAKMHPSIALLPSAADAATAFAEVYFAIDLLYREHGRASLRAIIDELQRGEPDKRAIEKATGRTFLAFEKAWLAHVKRQPFPKDLLSLYKSEEQRPPDVPTLAEDGKAPKKPEKKGREISFGAFKDVQETDARRHAHLGELLRERNRVQAAAEQYSRAHRIVGDKYSSISNKYALALMELSRLREAEDVLTGSLRLYPDTPSTHVHLGRIHLTQGAHAKAKAAYVKALASDPFDPEIHLALFLLHEKAGEAKLAERARNAAAVLTKRTPEEVPRLAAALLREETQETPSSSGTTTGSSPDRPPSVPKLPDPFE